MKKIIMIIAIVMLSTTLYAQNQPPVVSNVQASQQTGTKTVEITYDLTDPDGDTMTITVMVSRDGGDTYDFMATSVTGDAGSGVTSGTGKTIYWDAGTDHPEQYGDNYMVKVIADDGYFSGGTGTVTDIDGNVYQTIVIGNQEWMMSNLKVTKYANGDPIPNVTDYTEWFNLSTGARSAYDNKEDYVSAYGYLYNWYAVNDSRDLAPAGWRIPTDDDWKQLEMYLGMSQLEADDTGWRGNDEGGKLKVTGTTFWKSPNTGATNGSGFSAHPSGYRGYHNGYFYSIGEYAHFWTASEYSVNSAWPRGLYYNSSQVTRNSSDKKFGHSVRCIKIQ